MMNNQSLGKLSPLYHDISMINLDIFINDHVYPTRINFPLTVDVVYTWKYRGPHILNIICANKMKLCVYNTYVLQGKAALWIKKFS